MIEPLHSGDGSTKKEQRVKTSLPKGRTLFLLITSFFLIIESACRTQSLKKPEFSEAQTGRAWQDYIRIDSSAKANAVSDTIVPLKIGEESASENSGLQADWWKIFNSSALTNLEEKALANNLNLKLAALRIQENRANATVLRANLYPSVYFDPSYTKQKFSAYRPNQFGNGSLPEITLSTYSMPFDVSYEIDVWGKFRYGLLANEATIRASQMERSVIQLSLTADVATNYLTVINLNRRLRIYNRTLDSRRQGLAINQQLYKAGLITQQDVTQAEIELASVEATITDLRRNSSTAQNNLAELCNLPFNNFLIDTAASDVDLPKIPLSVPSKLLNRRPDVAQYWALLQGAESQQEVAKAAYLPA
ncbi:MAG: TolC family protein, partial [Bacteroidota bacterium]